MGRFADSLTTDASTALLGEIVEKLNNLPNGLRQSFTDHLWASIPNAITEWNNLDALAAGGTLTVNPQTSNLELITSVIACIPTGTTAVLQLGGKKLYLSSGTFTLAPCAIMLAPSDTRAITLAAAGGGPTALLLCGEQRPTFGKLAS